MGKGSTGSRKGAREGIAWLNSRLRPFRWFLVRNSFEQLTLSALSRQYIYTESRHIRIEST
jgi:hypothetical protein